ncbi:uncharacterized protein LOC111368635 [Olea europaea var. sylvestris]|uniref:uncharacterized protein LOC111368635 n=1 Tax=Olea europaea var. sylvestris TaxID=158386 RepID=UPI000C1D04E7|nr:uncharacterized protein LOC111368635 [Olea europaea var. sylvestris]
MDLCLDDGGRPLPIGNLEVNVHGQGSDIWSPHDDDRADEAEMQEGNAGEGSDKRSPHDDDHADEGEIHEVNDGEGGDEHSPQDDDRVEEGVMQEMNDPGETVPILPSDENEEGPSTHDVTEVDDLPAQVTILEKGGNVCSTNRRRSTRVRRPAPPTRTSYMRKRVKRVKK